VLLFCFHNIVTLLFQLLKLSHHFQHLFTCARTSSEVLHPFPEVLLPLQLDVRYFSVAVQLYNLLQLIPGFASGWLHLFQFALRPVFHFVLPIDNGYTGEWRK
jgi:uncharacterized membrane protein